MRIGILTNFELINPGYSLSSIVMDQAITLQRYGHEVTIFVDERFSKERSELPAHWDLNIQPKIPHSKLIDYKSKKDISDDHKKFARKLGTQLVKLLKGYAIVMSHDWIFTGWNLPFAKALLHAAPKLPEQRFLHWIHSIPTGKRDYWLLDAYGPNHRVVFPNRTDRLHVAQQFRTDERNIVVIPHIKDMRTFCNLSKETCDFLEEHQELLCSHITQIYPAATDRLSAKRLREVILLFATLKRKGYTIGLVIANQHGNKLKNKEDLEHYVKIARRNGLRIDEDITFTSQWQVPKYEKGIPRKILSELMLFGNLFFYPTREESFGLVLPEAVLMSGALPVLNKSLDMMLEVGGLRGLYVPCGAWNNPFTPKNEAAYFDYIADLILARMLDDDCLQARTFFRTTYNQDVIYQRYYEPIMKGAVLWT